MLISVDAGVKSLGVREISRRLGMSECESIERYDSPS